MPLTQHFSKSPNMLSWSSCLRLSLPKSLTNLQSAANLLQLFFLSGPQLTRRNIRDLSFQRFVFHAQVKPSVWWIHFVISNLFLISQPNFCHSYMKSKSRLYATIKLVGNPFMTKLTRHISSQSCVHNVWITGHAPDSFVNCYWTVVWCS